MLDFGPFPFGSAPAIRQRGIPLEGVPAHAPLRTHAGLASRRRGRRSPAVIDRTTRQITAAGGQIVKVAPWGRRRLAYQIDRHREGAYHIVLFEAPTEAIAELERGLLITEEVLRHLVTRVERPARPAGRDADEDTDGDETLLPSADDEEEDDDGRERIDESESEAAPAAID